jgi:hypothetical protein
MIKQPNVIFVVGSSRSGTSALTRVLSLCGCDLPTGLVRADRNNVLGYWESSDVINVNEELLRFMGVSCNDPANIDTFLNDRLSEQVALKYTETLAEILRRNLYDGPLVVKDPRLSLLLRHWLAACELIHVRPVIIMAFRWPNDVATSISKRDGLDRLSAKRLWLKFTLLAELQSRGYPRCFTAYENLLTDWRLEMENISRLLKIELTFHKAPNVDLFLRESLQHHSDLQAEKGSFNETCMDTYNQLLSFNMLTDSCRKSFDHVFDRYLTDICML